MKARTLRRVYLREAAVMLVAARLAVRLLAPARIFAWADRPPRRIRRFAGDEAQWVCWAVEECGARMNMLCLQRALAAHAMLRRRGIASRLCLGVARQGEAFAAHAWIEIGQDKVVGAGEAEGYTRLAAYGGVA
jgi:Transglutaminase-like superfamily